VESNARAYLARDDAPQAERVKAVVAGLD
jgi:hypothetical protein